MTLDDARYLFPAFGFAIYAYEPGGPVTAEVHRPDGDIMTAIGATEREALEAILGPPEAAGVFD